MKKIVSLILLLLFLTVNTVECAEVDGFLGIGFGTPYEEVALLLKQKHEKQQFSDGSNLTDPWKSFFSTYFEIGDRVFFANIYFDNNDNFYSYDIKSTADSASVFDTDTYNNGRFLTEVFKNKYGKPQKCYKPTFLNVRPGFTAYLCKWNNKNLDIYTGFSINTVSHGYYSVASVTNKEMEKKFNAYTKKWRKQKAVEGAKSF